MTTTVKIDNLKCHGCAHSISTGLLNIQGISNVEIDHDTSSVKIEHDQDVLAVELKAKLGRMGYPEFGTTSIGQKAKSYVSCAIGRLSE